MWFFKKKNKNVQNNDVKTEEMIASAGETAAEEADKTGAGVIGENAAVLDMAENIGGDAENTVNNAADNAAVTVEESAVNAAKENAVEAVIIAEVAKDAAGEAVTVSEEDKDTACEAVTVSEEDMDTACEAEAAAEEANDETADSEEVKEAVSEAPVEKLGFFARLKQGLAKTRNNIVSSLNAVFSANEINSDFYEEIEEILIMGDIGVTATEAIITNLKAKVKENHIKKAAECKQILIDSIKEQMQVGETEYNFEKETSVVMVIGVNGVGKTTTVGKLAAKLRKNGRKVLIAAADTFRAAAGDQLEVWAKRAEVPIVGSVNGADPASVVFDAVAASKARNVDVLLIDTAGRLHNKKNLMEELRKMDKIINREYPNAHRENLIVLDGTTGQNALVQAKEFSEVAPLTGIVLTKMDGTAKGGIAVAIQKELNIPVKYIGVGETLDDLQKFDSESFVDALFDVR